jgi:hypothetical protein
MTNGKTDGSGLPRVDVSPGGTGVGVAASARQYNESLLVAGYNNLEQGRKKGVLQRQGRLDRRVH